MKQKPKLSKEQRSEMAFHKKTEKRAKSSGIGYSEAAGMLARESDRKKMLKKHGRKS